MHQTDDGNGPRMFVPPNTDPIDRNYDPMIWREAALLGGAMALELQQDGRTGVISNAIYDYYWPGYEDSAPLGHNTVCLLTEVANSKLRIQTTPGMSSITSFERRAAASRSARDSFPTVRSMMYRGMFPPREADR